MKSSAYWQKRFEQLEEASNAYGVATYKEIEPAFDKAQREIDQQIEAWYGRLAKNNEITIQEARKMLSASELKEFQWDVKEYIRYGQENAVDGLWMKELENASARFHISRLEALKIRTQQAIEVAFGNELGAVDGMARRVFTEGYYHSIFEMQKGIGLGWEISKIDEHKLDKIIKKPWATDGRNFSDRIWQSKTQLINELHSELVRNCILGKAPDEAIKHIAKKFDVSKSQAGRLVMTEEAYFHSVAQMEAFKELGVEEYEILATLDSVTSDICRSLDGEVFPMDEYSPGSTAPPFHPWCRSVTIPHFDDNYGGERAARDADGITYYVPDDMTFKQWEKKYVKDATGVKSKDSIIKKALQSAYGTDIIKPTTDDEVKPLQQVGKLDKDIYSCVTEDITTDDVIITDKQIEHVKGKHPNDYEAIGSYLNEVVAHPDYIIEANKPNTALVLKELEVNGEKIKAVVRLATSHDDPSYKNSIITFMRIDDKEWNRLLRNKKILYKKE